MRRHVTASPAESIGRSGFRLLISFIAAIGVMILLVPGASALQRHPYTGTSFGPDGVGGSAPFGSIQGIAVDQGNGDVYAYDSKAGKVHKFNAAGEPADFSALSGNAIEGVGGGGAGEEQIAIAPAGSPGGTAGDIYVATGKAVKIYAPSGTFLGGLIPQNGRTEICGVAVDPAGHVFIGEYGTTIRELVPSANPVTDADPTKVSTAPLPGICNVAADGLGNVYAANYSGGAAVKLEGIDDPAASQLDPQAAGLAVDPSNNEIYVDRGTEFAQYDPAGDLQGTSGAGQMSQSRGIAVDSSSDRVYVGNNNSHRIEVFGPALTFPEATSGAATGVTKNTATLNGTVNPAGTETTYQFEYGLNKKYGNAIPASPAAAGNDSADHQFSAEASGLQPDSTYHFRIAATNANGTNYGKDSTFTTPGGLTVETTGSPVRTATTVRFDSRVFNHGNPTTYYFEYGDQGPCDSNPCTATDPQSAGSEYGIKLASQWVQGLAPATTYHYRVVAEDGSPESPATGVDMTVTTAASDARLTHGRLAGPPGSDRAWEQVNMPDTGGNPVGLLGNSAYGLFFSEDGERAAYPLHGGTPSSDTGSAYSFFYSERTSSAWQVKQTNPPRSELVGGNWSPESTAATPDLSTVITANTNLGNMDAAVWRLSPDAPPVKLFERTRGQNDFKGRLGLSADGSRAVAMFTGEVDPAFPSPGVQIYDVSSGSPRLASLLPNGQPCGSMSTEGQPLGSTRWVIDDGSRMLFNCGGLYVHNFDTGQSRFLSGCPVSESFGAGFIRSIPGAAFFISENALTTDDTVPPGSSCGNRDIYRFNFSDETFDCLTCVTSRPAEVSGATPAASTGVVAPDGSRLYFVSTNELIAGAPAGQGIYRLNLANGNLAYVGSSEGREGAVLKTNPDGSVLVFYANSPANNAAGGQQNGGTAQAYRYDDRDRSLVCMSCPADGSPPAHRVDIPFINELSTMSADGRTVVFVTPTPLSPLDQNTASPEQVAQVGTDAYEWRDGRLFLVSDGLSNWASTEIGDEMPPIGDAMPPVPAMVSPSGRDIYFMAAAQYTPDAIDAYRRLYDARIGGGFEFPPPPKPCPLEVCQGTPKGAPEEQAPGTGTFEGTAKQPTRHKAKSRKKKAHKKKHKSAKKKNRASNDRRTAR